MSNLAIDAFKRIMVAGMLRRSVNKASSWATKYRVMGKPYPGLFSFQHHPWLKEMHDAECETWVGRKSAQMGFTECLINQSFFANDILRESVLYILPTSDEASDFSATRFDPALELSPHLMHLYDNVKNVTTKRAGDACLYIRGSRSRSKLKSSPTAWIMIDEMDEMNEAMVRLALERASGQLDRHIRKVSTPSIEGYGIEKEFQTSTQEHFFFECPCCSRLTEFVFPDCLIVVGDSPYSEEVNRSYLQCKECKKEIKHEEKINFLQDGIWVPGKTNTPIRGFYISQLYSMHIHPGRLAAQYLKAQTDPVEEQEFYNSNIGESHIVAGSRLNDKDITNCEGSHGNRLMKPEGLMTMGVDVGTYLHFWIDQWVVDKSDSIGYRPITIYVDKVKEFHEFDKIIRDFRVCGFVVDRNPESRKAKEFCFKYMGMGYSCIYVKGSSPKTITKDDDERIIKVDRTSWLDLSLGRFHTKHIITPLDMEFEAREHLKNLTRIVRRNEFNEPIASYKSTGPDHYAHARNYSEMAFYLAIGKGVHENAV